VGRQVTVWLHGGSGVGKTALVRQFLEDARRKSDLVILDGRCYEREAVPYKALDSVVDRLGRYLIRLPRDEARALMPLDLPALVRLFPVLQEWRALRGADVEPADILDLQELRRRGFAAFRRVLEGIATRRPLVLFIDDLQWGDADSVALLADLISSSGAGALLFIGCYRSEEAGSSPLLRRLLPVRPAGGAGEPAVVDLELQKLDPVEATELATALLKEGEATPVSQAESIALEAAGNPFFISELARYAQVRDAGTQASRRRVSVSDVIRARSSRLSDGARRLLEVVAVAGRPVDLRIARRAAQISGGGYAELSQLRAARLVRTRSADGSEEVETYHDRIREAPESSLDVEVLKQHHYQLAVVSESSPRADLRVLAVHFRRAGITDKAFHYSVEAADQAAKALAFGGAAEWYRFALELGPVEKTAAQDLRVKLGDALSNAGKGPESAEAYLLAAESVRGVESLELRRRAAAQLMMSGRTDEGLALIRQVLTAFGMKPQTTVRSVLMFFFCGAASFGFEA
jgi:predicted ATPase